MSFGAFKDLSIHKKLALIILVNLIVALSMVSTIFVIYDKQESESSLLDEINVLTEVVASRSVAAIAFGDKRAAKTNLNALKSKHAIELACLYLNDGALFQNFSKFTKSTSICPEYRQLPELVIFDEDYLHYKEFILLKGKPVGALYVKTSLEGIHQRQSRITVVALLMIIVSCLLSYLVTYRMQLTITQPLRQLTRVAQHVRHMRDYSLRASHETDDEIGELVDSFNSMLNTIQQAHFQLRDVMVELTEKEQQSKQKALSTEEKNTAIKEFFAGVSHDLKQPLNAMSLFIEAIKNEKGEDKRQDLVAKLEQSIQNFNDLFTDLLDVNRLEYGQKKIDIENVSIGSITHTLVHEYGVLADDKGIRLSVRNSDYQVKSNPIVLERIIRNLISNAIRYTEKGGVVVGCRDRGDKIYIDVWDTGVGIPEDKLVEIFLPHMQLSNPDNKPEKGFGLGLSVVKKLCAQLGHELTVKSIVGKGTLMRLEMESVNDKPVISTIENLVNVQDPLSGIRIMIIDDEPDILQGMKLVVESWGCNYCLAENMQQVKEIVCDNNIYPDLIISDYTLSETLTGDMVIKFIREQVGKDIPAIVITGETDEALLDDIRDLGFKLLQKPVRPAKLRTLISYILKDIAD